MVDPIGTFAGAAPELLARLEKFKRRNGVRNLFALLEKDLKGRPCFPWEEVRQLAVDPRVQALLGAALERHEVDEVGLRKRLVELCDPRDYRATRGEFADEVLASIRKNLHSAIPDDRDAQQHIVKLQTDRVLQSEAAHHERLDARLERLERLLDSPTRVQGGPAFQLDVGLLLDMAVKHPPPPDISEVIATLRESSPQLAAQVLAAIGHEPGNAVEIIRSPPPWFASENSGAWRALGDLAMAAGRWEDAEQAFVRASALAGADRVAMLLRASECAAAGDHNGRAAQYFAQAAEINPASIRVRLVQIRALTDAEQQLTELDRLHPGTERDVRGVLVARAEALGLLERFDEAIAMVEELLAAEPHSLGLLDRAAGLAVAQGQRTAAAHEQPDRGALTIAAARSLELRRRLRGRGRDSETAGLLARAIIARALADDIDGAVALVSDEPSAEELADSEARIALADAAMYARQPERALQILGPENSWGLRERVLAAQAHVLGDERRNWIRGFELAAEIFDEPDVRPAAAFALVIAGTQTTDVEWRTDALAVLEAQTPALAAYLWAERLDLEGDSAGAEAVLVPLAEDSNALRGLIDRALADGNWSRALALSEQLLTKSALGSDRLRRVMALRRLGRRDRVLVELQALASDQQQPTAIRSQAFEALVHETDASDFAELLKLGVRWRTAAPDDAKPFWLLVYANAVLARRDAALSLLESGEHPPKDPREARLASQVYIRTLHPLEACRRIAALSDHFERRDEWLEEAIFLTSLRTDQAAADPQLRERIQQAAETFVARAPESESVLVFEAREPTALVEKLTELSRERDRKGTESAREVTHGNTPLGVPPAWWTSDGCAIWPAGKDVGRCQRPRRIRPSSEPRPCACCAAAAGRFRSSRRSWASRSSRCVTGAGRSRSMTAEQPA